MRRLKGVVAYDGTGFSGWQTQPGRSTIQKTIENAIQTIVKESVVVVGSGRTDRGVHSRGQTVHFDTSYPDENRLLHLLQYHLPQSIRFRSLIKTESDFNAQRHCKNKRYIYQIYQGRADPFDARYHYEVEEDLDVNKMQKACLLLQGENDFRRFTTISAANRCSTVRNMTR